MAYCVQADITARTPADVIEQLTDDDVSGSINATNLNAAIADADAEIDSYLRGNYDVPLDSPVDGLIKRLSVDLTVYFLYQRRLDLDMPESVENRYNRALEILIEIQEGERSIAIDSGISSSQSFKTNKETSDKLFSSDVWDTYN